MKDLNISNDVLHLYRRAGFGGLPDRDISINKALKHLFHDSENFTPVSTVGKKQESPLMSEGAMTPDADAMKKEKMKKNREGIRELNLAWMSGMAKGDNALRERMSLFWHGHFACRVQDAAFVQSYLNTIRKNALGNFGDMLMAVSKEPAMLQFLNNQQNRKNRPNENFAREVMELFTLGRGNYTEQDIKEGARAFTGWGFNDKGEFEFREKTHDVGTKNFLGKSGNFNGEDIIKILLEQKQTARFITAKIYRNFVSEILNEKRVSQLAEDFYDSDYDIGQLMHSIFSAKWFYEDAPKSSLIKSPVELIVGIQRTLNADFINNDTPLYIQKVLGQILFYPPNVAGWPGGRNWIDSSSLLFRMQLPNMMAGMITPKIQAKESGDVNDQTVKKKGENPKINVDWEQWAKRFEKVDNQKLPGFLCEELLAVKPDASVMALIVEKERVIADRTLYIRKLTLAIMGLPEYQIS
ncbi:DUF1800 family protein [Dyadobacter sp. CY356]|uniref:DUF1800 domain-containing protein n=1 Tax=Dyadobacter sp. CY356 TaxID=2906442 RepID=UPI001F2AB62B|nr:DUF1800 domain-containing protein [Dyadobacter sp. CY356]MCF0057962.1 DUF1800 domain-containing protein [Dyadobacter sp. CY356]